VVYVTEISVLFAIPVVLGVVKGFASTGTGGGSGFEPLAFAENSLRVLRRVKMV
jgi:hypothetical protein